MPPCGDAVLLVICSPIVCGTGGTIGVLDHDRLERKGDFLHICFCLSDLCDGGVRELDIGQGLFAVRICLAELDLDRPEKLAAVNRCLEFGAGGVDLLCDDDHVVLFLACRRGRRRVSSPGAWPRL